MSLYSIAIQPVASLASTPSLEPSRLLTLEMERPWDGNTLSYSRASVVRSAELEVGEMRDARWAKRP